MKQKLTMSQSKERLHQHYRRMMTGLLKKQKTYLEKPTSGLKQECDELQGYLRGIKKTLSFVEERMSDNEFDLGRSA